MRELFMRPDEQALKPSLSKINEGIHEFRQAVLARIESNDWQDDHLRELDNLSLSLLKYQKNIINLKIKNW
jgi:hypothetical protein